MEVEAAAAAKRKAEQDKAWKEAEALRRRKEAAEHAKREAAAAGARIAWSCPFFRRAVPWQERTRLHAQHPGLQRAPHPLCHNDTTITL